MTDEQKRKIEEANHLCNMAAEAHNAKWGAFMTHLRSLSKEAYREFAEKNDDKIQEMVADIEVLHKFISETMAALRN